ncbi:hypothetical protein NIBR502774_14335 (plasmid) [Rhizobium sp. NIBRBAC000502774]|nr:hypothetical protein NIBR502774_14335 [Rhizobium sp. NIBRBAC000502774]
MLISVTTAHSAEKPTALLESALRLVPSSVLASADPMPVVFMDVGTLSKATGGALSDKALMRTRFSQHIRPLGALGYGGAKTWDEKAGIAFDKISYFAAFGPSDRRISYWGLSDAADATKLLDTLKTTKFKEVSASPLILANGEPRAINLANREPDNPWSGSMGNTSAVTALNATIAQASAPEDLTPLASIKSSVVDEKAVSVALRGMDTVASETNSDIIQAAVVTPLMGASIGDPAVLLKPDQDLTQLTKAFEEQIEQGHAGVPAYASGIVADLTSKSGPALAISLAYGNCEDAQKAVAGLEARWKEGMATAVSVTGKTVEVAKDGCAAFVRFDTKPGDPDAFAEFLNTYMQRGFNILQIGSTQ